MASRALTIAARIGERYRALPPEVRTRFEEGLASAKATLEATSELPSELRKDVLALFYEVVLAVVAGTLGKVRLAMAEGCPELYVHFHEVLGGKVLTEGGADAAL